MVERSPAYWKLRQECLEKGFWKGYDRVNQEATIVALRKGLSVDLIMDLTGLSQEEIERIRASLEQ
jgi:hypothetical protein